MVIKTQKIEAHWNYLLAIEGDLERVSHYVRSIGGAEGASAGLAYGELYATPRMIGTSDMIKLVGDWKIPAPFEQNEKDA